MAETSERSSEDESSPMFRRKYPLPQQVASSHTILTHSATGGSQPAQPTDNISKKQCNAFKRLTERIFDNKYEIHSLDPENGCLTGECWNDTPLSRKAIQKVGETDGAKESDKRKAVLKSFLLSGVVKTVVIFEGYIYDLFCEAYDFTDWKDIEICKSRWHPACEQIIKKFMSKNMNKDSAYQVIEKGNVWSYILQKHRDDTLEKMAPTIRSMEEKLVQLFQHTGSGQKKADHFPLDVMVKNESFNVHFDIPASDGVSHKKLNVTINNLEAVSHILDLFYAIRCMAVHDRIEPTLDGALRNFPTSPGELKIGNDEVERYLFGFYQQIREIRAGNTDKSGIDIDYYLCVNANRFYHSVSKNLMMALGHYAWHHLKHATDDKFEKFWGLSKSKNGEDYVMDIPVDKKEYAEATLGAVERKQRIKREKRVGSTKQTPMPAYLQS